MNVIEIPAVDVRQEVPSSWNEMSVDEVCFSMRLLWDMEHGIISPLEFHIKVLYKLLYIKRSWYTILWERLHPELMIEKNANVFKLCASLLDWLFVDTEEGMLPTFDTVINPLPKIRSRIHCLIGPADGLQDLTLAEFRNALIARDEFLKTQQTEALDRMIAFLYRRKASKTNRGGRCVAPIGYESFNKDVRRASHIAPWKKQTILMWFSACVKFIQTATITVAGEQIDMSTIFRHDDDDDLNTTKGNEYTWTDVIYEIAKEQALGTMDDIDNEGLYNIFTILHHNIKQARRYEKS